MVHASHGRLKAGVAGPCGRNPAIIAGLARARRWPASTIDWEGLIENYDRIRDKIEEVFPDFPRFQTYGFRQPGGFRLTVAAVRPGLGDRRPQGTFSCVSRVQTRTSTRMMR